MKTIVNTFPIQRAHPRGVLLAISKRWGAIWSVGALAALLLLAAAPRAQAGAGTLVSWGESSFALEHTPTGTFTAVAAGYFHNVGIKHDGTLVSWGEDPFGAVSGTPGGTFTAVAAGDLHSVGIRTDGTLVSWGDNSYGQVSGTPAGTFTAVSAGHGHSVGIKTDGTVVSWGDDEFYYQGGGMRDTFTAVAAGDNYLVGIKPDGTLDSRGYGQEGSTPAGTFTAVAVGHGHSVAIKTDGTLVSWGEDHAGQVSDTPAGAFSAVAAAGSHSVAIVCGDCNQLPVAQCRDVTVSAGADCTAAASIDNGSSDPDAGDIITLSQSPAGPYALGQTRVTLTVMDSHGASSSCTAVVTVVDDTPPSISCPISSTVTATSAAGAVATFATPGASDNCSAASVTCVPASGSQFPLGVTTVTCTATDGSLNTAQCTFNVSVICSWSGVLQPINADGSSVFKAGSTVSVKFQLSGAGAGITDAVATLSYVKVGNNLVGSINEGTSNAAASAGNQFRFDPTSGQYIYNWSTKGLNAGIYQLQIDLGDGVSRTVNVALK